MDQRAAGRRQKAAGRPQPTIGIRIEELVLHGFPPGDRHRIGDAVEQELARLLGSQGVPLHASSGREIEEIDAGSISLAAGAHTRAIGGQIAAAVYGALGRADSGQT